MATNNFTGFRNGIYIKPATLPGTGNLGDFTFDTASSTFKYWNGSTWVAVGSGSGSALNLITNGDAEAGLSGTMYALTEAVTFTDAGDLVNLTAHTLQNNDPVSFSVITTTTGISINTLYYVVGVATNSFQVSLTVGGAAIALTTNGSGTLLRGRPVTGTGGAASSTWTLTASTPNSGTNSYLFTKSANNRMGEGVAFAFTVDPSYRSKVLNITCDYVVGSGTFAAGTSTTDSDLIPYIYDVTNSTIIQPSSFKFLSNSTSIVDRFNATFQTSATGASYRLMFHVATPSTSAFTIKVDNIVVTPSNYSYGTPITDWQSYTPTFTGFGTPSAVDFWWRRAGDTLEISGRATAGTTTASGLTFTLPTGLVIYSGYTGTQIFGYAARSAGLSSYIKLWGLASTPSASTISVTGVDTTSATIEPLTAVAGTSFTSGQTILVKADMKIQGWSSSVQTSDQTDTRVVGFRARRLTTATAITGTTAIQYDVIYNTTDFDTHGTFNGTTWTCSVPGYYKINAAITWAASATVTGFRAIMLIKNGVTLSQKRPLVWNASASALTCSQVDDLTYFNAGDTLKVQALQNSGATVALEQTDANINVENIFSVIRQAGPNQIAASESVNARYTNTAGTSIANTGENIVAFATKDVDSHGAFVTNTFTCPIPGKYRLSAAVNFVSSTYAAANNVYGVFYKNGSAYSFGPFAVVETAITTSKATMVTATIPCNAGDTLDFRVLNNRTAGATSLTTSAGFNWITIERVGN